ncbi:MAG: DNA-directed RNA polymerase subunit H [Haloferacaceae archaeon]
MVDVSEHDLVPEHTVLDEDEAEAVLAEYEIERTSLPKIKRRDPALPDEASPGDIVQIDRDSRTTDVATVYRLVID